MANLFLVRNDDPRFAKAALHEARAVLGEQGFPAPTELALPSWTLLHAGHIVAGPPTLMQRGDDLVAIAGTLVADGKLGQPALAALLDMDPLALDWDRLGGQFVALVRRQGRTFLFGDYFAAFQLFHDTQDRSFATAFLAAARAQPRLSFDAQGVYELVFNVMPTGDDTIFEQLKTLSPNVVVELTADGVVRHAIAKPLPDAADALPLPERIAQHRDRLLDIVGAHVDALGGNVRAPLSGGLDSRLVLAALRARGCAPHIYVYGVPADEDVVIAHAIGAELGFPVEWLDKEDGRVPPDAFPELVDRNYRQFDGLPTFGNLFDNGTNGAAQLARHADGALAVSGGCGEIYRNFFYLPDRRYTTHDIARTFFARFTPADATDRFVPRDFLDRIAGKMAEALGPPPATGRLPRNRIEQLYPRIRCRALFGREISLEARFSPYLMPFLDHRVVAEAMTLPLPLKYAGRFEAMLLDAIDPVLAAQPSAYGHDFTGPPNLAHRRTEFMTRIRPVWLRRHSYALRRRLGPMGDEHGGAMGDDYMARVIDLDFPAMRPFFNVDAITDSAVWRRVANLEYLAARLGSRVTG
ncbi:asparagine synthase C-terminal domain-containing protein [Sphingomonas sp. ST-64]|uniref:Asparagine synthase C-terminal domain-containing protein n=1 Tax=Sphingomonas plantiphila TaxID=3163295 RepID=A0ABW8YM08_9SPHN